MNRLKIDSRCQTRLHQLSRFFRSIRLSMSSRYEILQLLPLLLVNFFISKKKRLHKTGTVLPIIFTLIWRM